MKRHFQRLNLFLGSAAIMLVPPIAASQGAFVNLNFESASIPIIPAGQIGSPVTVAQGLPGWTAYVQGTPVTQIGHNDMSIGGAYISIRGPQWNSSEILQGSYTVLLESALIDGTPQPSLTAAIGQTGLVPSTARSVRFFAAAPAGPVQVSFNGQSIPVFQLGSATNYIVYGGDISAFAGQSGELRLTSPESPINGGAAALLDNIFFSTRPIPEPGVLSLFAVGLSLLGWRTIRNQLKR